MARRTKIRAKRIARMISHRKSMRNVRTIITRNSMTAMTIFITNSTNDMTSPRATPM
ncbi:MAG: hypothetical protein ACFFAN_11730 [Promethearchaeota archaeon]